MGTLSLSDPVNGTTIDASLHVNNNTAIKAVVNGGIENANVNASAAIDGSKLSIVYSAFSPTWASSGTPPTLGNGTLSGIYAQVGKFVQGAIYLLFGSTTDAGTGNYTFSLPGTVAAFYPSNFPLGSAVVSDASPTNIYTYTFTRVLTTTGALLSAAAPGVPAAAGTPITFATGDTITINFTYEAA